MKLHTISLAMAMMIGVFATIPAARAAEADGPGVLGMNLSGPADWNTELPFVDAFRISRQWISQKKARVGAKAPPWNWMPRDG